MSQLPKIAGFHQFLLMRGKVTTEQFFEALSRQQHHQGDLARYAEDFREDPEQGGGARHARRNDHQALCEALVDMGLMTRTQVERTLYEFMEDQARFAELAMVIPHGVPHRSLIARTFEIAGELLSSQWNTQWVTDSIETLDTVLPASDLNVRLAFGGGFAGQLVVSAPHACAMRAGSHLFGPDQLSAGEAWELLAEFTNQIGGQAVAAMATQNVASTIGLPERLAAPIELRGQRAVRVGLRTADGEIGLALSVDSA